ncbi:hypothetical protein [Ornithinimicrobium avium]|uniref:Uncharacterized protein n=1 Tax=Ornithinimicrobium avium TaxID=2283195 RepID=A0A345NIU9_9MICO|nr:hypothetical protein [Ornithinimicrobium avium]AXH94957.1 hypothetical protein DV701_01090 [Ornithinimicrobium avium]
MTSALSQVLVASAEGGHHIVNELLFSPIWFGVIALAVFLVLLMTLWFFRNTLALDPHHVAGDRQDPDTHTTPSGTPAH